MFGKSPQTWQMIEQSGKTHIILGGITLKVFAMFPALSQREAGYQAYTVMGISGSQSSDVARWAERSKEGTSSINFPLRAKYSGTTKEKCCIIAQIHS